MTSANQKLSAKTLQDMIEEQYKKENNQFDSVYNTETPGKSPSDISFEKSCEIYSTLATPLKNMRMQAMKETAASCFKEKWMDEAFPNPHQVEMCRERMQNKHMGHFYRNMVNLRESNKYRYQDCVKEASNNLEGAVLCVRNYITGIDADNATLKGLVEANSAKYF